MKISERAAKQTAKVLLEGFQYLEGIRWYKNELWCSDMARGQVLQIQPSTKQVHVAAEIPGGHTSGIGFLPDGTPLVVEMGSSTLNRIVGGTTEVVADLSHVAVALNDMWVDPTGRAYIGQMGFDFFGGADIEPSTLVIVEPNGQITTAGQNLISPNGIGLSPNGKTLYTAESFGFRVTAFDRNPKNGKLSNQRVVRQWPGEETGLEDGLDGLCMDKAGGIWVAAPYNNELRRVHPQTGKVTDVIKAAHPDHWVIACALGGPDMKTLYLATADTDFERLLTFNSTARIETARVKIPGLVTP